MAFKYQARSERDWENRANQSGSEFSGIILPDFKVYAPKKGENWIRILPPTWENPSHFGVEVHVHYNIGVDRAQVICLAKQDTLPANFERRCPVCEARVKMERAGADEEDIKELKINKRVCVWLVDRKEPDKGPQIWPMSWTIDKDICKRARDKRTGAVLLIDHPDDGYDITFDKTGEQIRTRYEAIELDRQPSSVDDVDLDYIQDHPLPECLHFRTYDEVKELFEAGGGGETSGRRDRDERGRSDDRPTRSREETSSREREDRPRDGDRRASRDAPERQERTRDDRGDDRRGEREDRGRGEREAPRRDREEEPRRAREETPRREEAPPPRERARYTEKRTDDDESLKKDDEFLRRDKAEAPRDQPERSTGTDARARANSLRERFGNK